MNKAGSIICKVLFYPVISLLLIKKISGKENLPKSSFILAANHQSNLDHAIIASFLFPKNFKFIGQTDGHKGIKKIMVDFFYSLCGVIPLDRTNAESKKSAMKKAEQALKKGYVVCIYPEGTRTRTGKLGQGKTGAAKIFLQTKAPIVPVAIKGAFELFPAHGKLKIKKQIEIKIGRPVYFKKEFKAGENLSFHSEKYKNLCQKISDKIMFKIADLIKK